MQYYSFLAANSGKGFISFFNSILDEKSKNVYYIKGGPGCGKSTMMKQIAEKETDAELILCSGDPESLDGVILPQKNAIIIDATAPHSHEPQFPGIGGNIIDLGIGFEPEKLNKRRIIELCEEKATLYKSCYKVLASAKALQEGAFFPLKKQISISKIAALGDKLLKQNALWETRAEKGHFQKRFFSAISAKGCITLSETFETLGKNIILLEDRWQQSSLLLEYLSFQLQKRGIFHLCGFHPLFGEGLLQHLIIPEAELSIISKDGIFSPKLQEEQILRTISMQGMISKEYLADHKNKLTFIKKMQNELLQIAVSKLEKAKAIHIDIEAEYAKGFSFEATEFLKEKLINNLFQLT